MDTYHVVLYLHFMSLFVGVGAASVIGVCLFRLRASQTLADAAPWGTLAGQTERVFPVAVLGLFATGAYMTSDLWTWSTHWIEVSVAGLVLVALQGPLLAGRRTHALTHALMENGPGPLGERTRQMTRDPILWIVTFANPAIVFAIVWNMTEKPGVGGSVAAIVVGYAVGAAAAWPFVKKPAVEAEIVTGAA
jgi:hypothetical protein